jgi:hypothetical protein
MQARPAGRRGALEVSRRHGPAIAAEDICSLPAHTSAGALCRARPAVSKLGNPDALNTSQFASSLGARLPAPAASA